MIALENNIEQESAQEKTSITDMQSRTVDGFKRKMSSPENFKYSASTKTKSESAESDVESKGESKNGDKFDTGKEMAKIANKPDKQKNKIARYLFKRSKEGSSSCSKESFS